jgi:hypothetical protein
MGSRLDNDNRQTHWAEDSMKKFFNKLTPKGARSPSSPLPLHPQFVAPPVPHPCPHDHIALLVTKDGLLLRPHMPGLVHAERHVRITWGKNVKVEDLDGDGEAEGHDWSESVIIYGIVGILELFSGTVSAVT